MSSTGTIQAGPCNLGSDCKAQNKTCQARCQCIHCGRGLHGLFCSETTEDDSIVQCLHGYGCNKATAGIASCPLECPNSSKSDDTESIAVLSVNEEGEESGTTSTCTLLNATGNRESERNKAFHVHKTTGCKKVLLCSF